MDALRRKREKGKKKGPNTFTVFPAKKIILRKFYFPEQRGGRKSMRWVCVRLQRLCSTLPLPACPRFLVHKDPTEAEEAVSPSPRKERRG